ncbi:hypothetical protein BDV96DRAFT_594566 [Lophiotrema nucula]|uniref:Uncharacterized protein n=1 Tax=Lophiotrema nucula TaxID=690887 RepID=A0A6A5ZNT8_9PLEO|nr:hypothetical protein BDV96DRAFT_594566 [Lophiotrema nucula]
MAGKTPSEEDVANTLSHLQLSTNQKSSSKPKSKPVADSWDDELSSGSDTETETLSKTNTKDSLSPINTISSSTSDAANGPNPPPPTPASPHPFEFPDNVPFSQRYNSVSKEGSGAATSDKRPEKTTAVASRIIAAGLGIRAPRRTEEEREYDKAMKEKAKKQREEERGREKREAEAVEARKRAVWDD